jgi:RsiW-degrading membrane proteinase PrsW (M82 family)
MFVAVYLAWKTVPTRRYGAVLGAAAGLGFGVLESILYIISILVSGESWGLVGIRIIVTPLMHPLWSAFVGIGVFALLANIKPPKSNAPKSPMWMPWLFLLLGMINHMVWDSFTLLPVGLIAIAINIILVFPIFAIILRDFLGGHFDFQNFLESLPEELTPFPTVPPPPPPPPP